MNERLKSEFEGELTKLNSTSFLLQEELSRIDSRRKEILMALALLKSLTQAREEEEDDQV